MFAWAHAHSMQIQSAFQTNLDEWMIIVLFKYNQPHFVNDTLGWPFAIRFTSL